MSFPFLFPESLIGHRAGWVRGEFRFNAIEEVHVHQTLVLHLDGSAGFRLKASLDVLPSGFGNRDATRNSGRFDALNNRGGSTEASRMVPDRSLTRAAPLSKPT